MRYTHNEVDKLFATTIGLAATIKKPSISRPGARRMRALIQALVNLEAPRARTRVLLIIKIFNAYKNAARQVQRAAEAPLVNTSAGA